MSKKQLTTGRATSATHDPAQLARQYGSDVIAFAEKDSRLVTLSASPRLKLCMPLLEVRPAEVELRRHLS